MEIDICRESNMTGPAQHKGPQCPKAGPVSLALAASPGWNWEGLRAQARKCGVSFPRGSSSSGNWALERRNDAVAHPAGRSGSLGPLDHCCAWVGRVLGSRSSELTLGTWMGIRDLVKGRAR